MSDSLYQDFKKIVTTRAQAKRSLTLERVLQAIEEMKSNGLIINFNSLANYAKVSKAWLYRNPAIRKEISELRNVGDVRKRSRDLTALIAEKESEILSLKHKLAESNKINKKLKDQLEIVYGELHKTMAKK